MHVVYLAPSSVKASMVVVRHFHSSRDDVELDPDGMWLLLS